MKPAPPVTNNIDARPRPARGQLNPLPQPANWRNMRVGMRLTLTGHSSLDRLAGAR
jgi:hypothetical protein